MTDKEAIKYLQQLYPNGGHCWLDEQRIEAIGMAVKALQEEPVSEELEEEIKRYLHKVYDRDTTVGDVARHFAKWQKEHLWKPADGDDLPEYEREVVVFTQPYPLENSEYVVSFAHRPNPDGWDGKSLATGKIEHYTPKTYGEDGWNIPDVKWWLDCQITNMVED